MGLFSFIGGLIGARQARKERKIDRAREDNQLQRMVADAKLAGINPLSALGAANYNGGAGGTDFAALGSNLGADLDGMFPSRADKEARELELRRMRAETAMAESESIVSAQAARHSLYPQRAVAAVNSPGDTPYAPGGPSFPDPFAGSSDPFLVRDPKTGKVKLDPRGAPIQYLYVPYQDANGETVLLMNPNSPDLDQVAAGMAGHAVQEVKDEASPLLKYLPTPGALTGDVPPPTLPGLLDYFFDKARSRKKPRKSSPEDYDGITTYNAM